MADGSADYRHPSEAEQDALTAEVVEWLRRVDEARARGGQRLSSAKFDGPVGVGDAGDGELDVTSPEETDG